MAKKPISFQTLYLAGHQLECAFRAWLEDLDAGAKNKYAKGVKQYEWEAWVIACDKGLAEAFGKSSSEYTDWDELGIEQKNNPYFKAIDPNSDLRGYINYFLYFINKRVSHIRTISLLHPDPPPIENNIVMRDYYHSENADHVGPINANTVNIYHSAEAILAKMDSEAVLAQLQRLREEMAKLSAKDINTVISAGNIAEAEKALKSGATKSAMDHLKKAGHVALKFAEEISVNLVAEILKELLMPASKG
jgi:hypothetical protein